MLLENLYIFECYFLWIKYKLEWKSLDIVIFVIWLIILFVIIWYYLMFIFLICECNIKIVLINYIYWSFEWLFFYLKVELV